MRTEHCEVVIVGGGIAGASLAYFLSRRGLTDVVLLERELGPGRHATGRSAAVLVELDWNPIVMQLKRMAAGFLRDPPAGFTEYGVLDRVGIMVLFKAKTWELIEQAGPALVADGLALDLLTPSEAAERVPVLRTGAFAGAVVLPDDGNLDVHELVSSYLRHAARAGVRVDYGAEVQEVVVEAGRCAGVRTSRGDVRARWVVNAAGAWAGTLGRIAGAAHIDLVPMRRCVATFAAPEGVDAAEWPLVGSDDHKVYFKPESGGLLMSPMDEEPMQPCDPSADDLAIAEGMERLRELAPAIIPRSPRGKWAGLRTFASDGVPVVGEDPVLPGFFWLAGQGGSGIETSPALGEIAADLVLGGKTDRIDARLLVPARFQWQGAPSAFN